MIKVVARNFIQLDKVDEYISIAKKLVAETNKNEKGCLRYELFQDIANPQILTILEEWESTEALGLHGATKHFTALAPHMDACAEKPIEINLYTQLA